MARYKVQVTRSTPVGGSTALTELLYAAIAGARERLWVTTASFAPDRAFENIWAAARRGVDVRILVNDAKCRHPSDTQAEPASGQRPGDERPPAAAL